VRLDRAQPVRADRPDVVTGDLTPEARAGVVRTMFTRIAPRYDLMNSLMTLGRHHAWRRIAARATIVAPEGPALDLATGTGDLALAIARMSPRRTVIAADFSEAMLARARRKAWRARAPIALLAADALALPFADATFACVTSAFLLRNLADLERGLREMRRVTRPGGRVVALEITRPSLPVFSRLFGVYFRRVVPLVGAVVAGDRSAYTYLPDSVARFVSPAELSELMRQAGLRGVTYTLVGMGTVAIHTAVV
jgi:demethylmenaquinone methyltransferase/2-methoxy-6-polyprenyl-1,4-benzoquinol methylase